MIVRGEDDRQGRLGFAVLWGEEFITRNMTLKQVLMRSLVK